MEQALGQSLKQFCKLSATLAPHKVSLLFFQNFLLVKTSYITCGAQCKMNMQSPLFRNYQELAQCGALSELGTASSDLQPVIFQKADCYHYKAKQMFLKLSNSFFLTFQYLFCFSFVVFCIFFLISYSKSDTYFLRAYCSQRIA